MNKKILAVFAIFIFLILTVLSAAPTKAVGQGEWIVNYTVKDLRTGQILIQRDFQAGINTVSPILVGAELDITLTIAVPLTVPGSSLKVSTSMEHSFLQDRYWEISSTEYRVQNYNPNQPTITFSQIQGNLVVSCFGSIPSGITETTVGSGTVLHQQQDFALIQLTGPSGEILDQIKPAVVDAKIDEYHTLLAKAENTLQVLLNTEIAPAYISLYENIMNQSKTVNQQGFTDSAISLLKSLSVTEAPPSTGTTIADTFFLPAVGVLAALVVIAMLLFMRARGKAGYVSRVVEDQIRDLECLTLRASKVDKTLSSGLQAVEDKLKQTVGE